MLASSSFPELDTLGGPLPTNYHQPASAPAFKFIYYEKAPNFCKISTIDLSYVVTVKSTVEISQNFVAFSEYMNFTRSTAALSNKTNFASGPILLATMY